MPNLVPYFSLIMQKLKTTSCSTRPHETHHSQTSYHIFTKKLKDFIHNDRLATWTVFGLSFTFQATYRASYVIGKGCWCMDVLRRIRYFVQKMAPQSFL